MFLCPPVSSSYFRTIMACFFFKVFPHIQTIVWGRSSCAPQSVLPIWVVDYPSFCRRGFSMLIFLFWTMSHWAASLFVSKRFANNWSSDFKLFITCVWALLWIVNLHFFAPLILPSDFVFWLVHLLLFRIYKVAFADCPHLFPQILLP